jgi:hypothetical protein
MRKSKASWDAPTLLPAGSGPKPALAFANRGHDLRLPQRDKNQPFPRQFIPNKQTFSRDDKNPMNLAENAFWLASI